ncbi:unnamed protein product [Hermetia illucens]|uniref:DDE-1 domain-containing protein n=1 Tax=Hermetia illucens TaxID=343691 RepID=A0A7R8UYJ1_HERIL|nr:unnamed protein product [Hermetia illucens]
MTSVIQSMDQGIIKNFKHYYRRLLVENILTGAYMDKNNKITIDILQASRICNSSAWDMVTQKTIANCFKVSGEDLEDLQLIEMCNAVEDWADMVHNAAVTYIEVCGDFTDE